MRQEALEHVAEDLLSVFPLVFRRTRKKIIKTSIDEIDMNITHLHYEIIKLLYQNTSLHVAEIGEKLLISKAQMTQLVNKLVDLNLIEKRMSASDRRVTNISLTRQGRSVYKKHTNELVASIVDNMGRLSNEELEELSNSLKKMQDILSKL